MAFFSVEALIIDEYSAAACIAVGGILSHLLYFRHGEHHLCSIRYLQLAIAFPVICTFGLWAFLDITLSRASITTVGYEVSFISSSLLSMLIYRVSPYHRLSNFPGPVTWRLTKLVHCWRNRDFRGFKVLDDLHQKYGEYVRTGPSDLSITDPDAASVVNAKCSRAAWYSMTEPVKSVFHTRNRPDHDKRRRIWDQGLNTKALQDYRPQINAVITEFEHQIAAFEGNPMDISKWSNYFAFDLLGEVGYSRDFGMMKETKTHFMLELLEEGQKWLGVFGVVPWLFIIFLNTPGINYGYKTFNRWCMEQLLIRQKMHVKRPDILSSLLEAGPMTSDKIEDCMWLKGDNLTLIVAGSQSTASILTFACYHLSEDRTCTSKLREELAPLQDAGGNFDPTTLQIQATYLNAFLNEVMRLHAPLPSGAVHKTPPEGIHIGERFIPGDVDICVPQWTLNHSPRCYVDPLVFIPERWTTKPELLLRKDAFTPFGAGPYTCAGKQLALMELRMVIAKIVMRFDLALAPGEDGSALLDDMKDYFTLRLAKCLMVFEDRLPSKTGHV